MKKAILFENAPDYCFSDEERGNTVLIWPEADCIRCRESLESGEIIEYRIFGYDMPTTDEEFSEIENSIATGDEYAREWL